MDDAELIDELLELTLACERDEVSADDGERLERLLSDHPSAIGWYLRDVADSFALRAALLKRGAPRKGVPPRRWKMW